MIINLTENQKTEIEKMDMSELRGEVHILKHDLKSASDEIRNAIDSRWPSEDIKSCRRRAARLSERFDFANALLESRLVDIWEADADPTRVLPIF